VLARMTPVDGEGWLAYAEAHEATVMLAAPLGARELVHAPVDGPQARPGAQRENPAGPGRHAPEEPDL